MAFDRTNELIARRSLAATSAEVAEIDHVIPAAHYFRDISDYWNQIDPKTTQKGVETALIKALWIFPINFRDDYSGGGDMPRKLVDYEFYWFCQYALTREDESDTPDIFEKQVLLQHNDFVGGWFGLQEQFQRKAVISELSEEQFIVRNTAPIVQIEPVIPMAVCEFIPRVVGYAVRLQETIEVKTVEC